MVLLAATVCTAGNLGEYLIEPRYSIVVGDGEPSNDMPSFGLLARYHFSGPWHYFLSADYTEFDFETPYKVLGITNAGPVIDSTASGFYLGGGVEYEFNVHNRIKPYVNGGLGIGFLDADDISGTSSAGTPFTIKSDPGTEFIPFVTAGVRWNFWRNLSLDLAAKAEYHMADWEVKDTVSNQKATIDDYAAFGGYVGVAVHF